MKTNELTKDDHKLALGIASLTAQGVTVSYDAVTGEVHVSGAGGRSELLRVLTEGLAVSLVGVHRLTTEIQRCLNVN